MITKETRPLNRELNKSHEELHPTMLELRQLVESLCRQNEVLRRQNEELRRQNEEHTLYRIENSRSMTKMSQEFCACMKKEQALRKENEELKAALTHLAEQNQLKTNRLYGRGTEKLGNLIHAPSQVDEVDEANEEAVDIIHPATVATKKAKDKTSTGSVRKHVTGQRKKQPGKRKEDFSKLPQRALFWIPQKELDARYGTGNWKIDGWKRHTTLEKIPYTVYALNTYTPIISARPEHELVTVPYESSLLKRSFASPSIVADVLYQKYMMAVPLYRQALSYKNFCVPLSRQTMCNWVIRFALDLFGPVYDYLREQLLTIPYHQCDETTLRVNKDGRKAGAKSYLWVHITSELLETHPIILFCYELTRGTDHLRKFYEDFKGFITSDAYCAYRLLEKENEEVIRVCGCMMHMRRRYAEALSLIDKKGLDEEAVAGLPETQALEYIGDIYQADEKLKNLSAQERKERRDTQVRPLVCKFYEYIEGLDTQSPLMTNRFREAIGYSLNQKEYLCRFLEDGNIPIDDGATERHIRPFTIGRNNFLFCDSIAGAEATAILYTMVETARANQANVYWYLRYVLEQMPKHMEETERSFFKTMVPWSEEYQEYEKRRTSTLELPLASQEYTSSPMPPYKEWACAEHGTGEGVA